MPPDSGQTVAATDAADGGGASDRARLLSRVGAMLRERVPPERAVESSRRDLAHETGRCLDEALTHAGAEVTLLEQRDLITEALNAYLAELAAHGPAARERGEPRPDAVQPAAPAPETPASQSTSPGTHTDGQGGTRGDGEGRQRSRVASAKASVQPVVMERIDVGVAATLPSEELEQQIGEIVNEVLSEQRIQLNLTEQRQLVRLLVDDMLGLGPLEPLLADESVTDIMVNGAKQVYVERQGKLELTTVEFRDDQHVMNIATRIVTRIGRRIDESNPLVDARLEDGSRVNIIAPPLAIDGPSISIRKFAQKRITLEVMARQGNISQALSHLLGIATRSRLNILVSGGTGSGKTTLLNAMSRMIDHGERIVTIEDAAELQLQQPHVVRLETRPPSLEGGGEITMRDLVKNALRMRPDRIILGEVRSQEALDMLQAMNTGHEGSLSTVHANSPREALTRLENMVAMSGVQLPPAAVRQQIADAIHMIVQISRMRDGQRRVAKVSEVVGMEGEVVTTQDLFTFEVDGEAADGRLQGRFESSGLRPHFTPRAEYHRLGNALLETMGCR